jgi:predicted homoserine dehydrogenase-like protein
LLGSPPCADAASGRALAKSSERLLAEVDKVVVSETPAGSPEYRNRHAKTRLRQLIEGPFLFLDSDTLVRGDVTANHSRENLLVKGLSEGCRALRPIAKDEVLIQDDVESPEGPAQQRLLVVV